MCFQLSECVAVADGVINCAIAGHRTPGRYDTFELKSDMDVKAMLDMHWSSGNVILELYTQFVDVEEGGPSSATVLVNLVREQEAESPITRLCDCFMALL
ncbi:hypothetical protein J1N35_040171 [Gossypium stocksii]|uniref:Uncharacterized protein n=1 Tax=Gossypium stocksii TaxID=47602 RepID=A0A9D3ZI98_9ROSI|nr:hypothetical protein J1N35_040171 [Gossypium stocksii]